MSILLINGTSPVTGSCPVLVCESNIVLLSLAGIIGANVGLEEVGMRFIRWRFVGLGGGIGDG